MNQDWSKAAQLLAAADPLFDDYPQRIRNQLLLLSVEARLGIEDTGAAEQYLDLVRRDEPDAFTQAQVDFLEGKRLLADSEVDQAVEIWQQVVTSSHTPSAARARLALIDLGLEQEDLTSIEAIEQLEHLRFAWRGDEFEFSLLERLADLYVASGRYRDGLVSLRQAASHLPDSPNAEAAARHMREIFARSLGLVEQPVSQRSESRQLGTAAVVDQVVGVAGRDNGLEGRNQTPFGKIVDYEGPVRQHKSQTGQGGLQSLGGRLEFHGAGRLQASGSGSLKPERPIVLAGRCVDQKQRVASQVAHSPQGRCFRQKAWRADRKHVLGHQ